MANLSTTNNFPKLHNSMWPGVVGKTDGHQDSEQQPVGFKEMLTLTAGAKVDGFKFDGVDLFLPQHPGILEGDGIKALADEIGATGLAVGSLVANVWAGSAFGTEERRAAWLGAVREGCLIGQRLRNQGIRKDGIIRIDTSDKVGPFMADAEENFARTVTTLKEAAVIARDAGERLGLEGEVCWGGIHSARKTVRLLEAVGEPKVVGFQADMAHTYLFTLGVNALEDAIVGQGADMADSVFRAAAYRQVARQLRPWLVDLHVAQNDGTVHGEGTHDKTGKHCPVNDPNGKLDIVNDAGAWLRTDAGELTKSTRIVTWDGCMQPTSLIRNPKTYEDILAAMLKVREAHGWQEN